MQPRHGLRALGALLVAFALVMAACTDDDAEDTTTTAAADDTTTTAAPSMAYATVLRPSPLESVQLVSWVYDTQPE